MSTVSKKLPVPNAQKVSGTPLLTQEHLEKFPYARVVGYARVSTEMQSIDHQVHALKQMGATKLFWDILSGSDARRPWFNLMKKHVEAGDILLVYSASRLFRNTELLLGFYREMKELGVRVISLTEHLDLDTRQGRLIATIQGAVAQNELEEISERTRHGMAERKRQGQMMGRPVLMTPDKIKAAKRMRRQKVPVGVISQRLGISKSAVYGATKSQPR